MTRKLIYIMGSAVIGVVSLLVVMLIMLGTGALDTTPDQLVFSTPSADKLYDGKPLTATDWTLQSGSLRDGHTANVVVSGTQTQVGTGDNYISVIISDRNGVDVTDYYQIEYDIGTLTVEPRPLEISAFNASKTYDGTPLVGSDWEIASGSLAEGQTVQVTLSGTLTNVGQSICTPSATILDANGRDVSGNYTISCNSALLSVTKRHLALLSPSADKTYDGTPMAADGVTMSEGTLVDGQQIAVTNDTSILHAGEKENLFAATIYDENGQDVTANYEMAYVYGSLKVHPVRITVQTGSDTKQYDGTPLTCPTWTLVSGEMLPNNTLSAGFTEALTNCGTIENIAVFTVTDENGTDVTQNYSIETINGTLTVTPLHLVISTASAIKEYDGTPLTAPEYQIESEQKLLEGHTITEAVMLASITNAYEESVSNSITSLVISDGDGLDMTGNYDIKFDYGTLVVLPREITVRTGSASKDYDGTELTCNEWKIVSLTGLLDGHEMQIAVSGTLIEPGEEENITAEEIILDENGQEVTKNYDITYQYGKLVVKGEIPDDGGEEVCPDCNGEGECPDCGGSGIGGAGTGGSGGSGSGEGEGEGSGSGSGEGEGEGSGSGSGEGEGEGSGSGSGEGEGEGEGEGTCDTCGGSGTCSGCGGSGESGSGSGESGGGSGSGTGSSGDTSQISGPPADREVVTVLQIKTPRNMTVYLRERSYGDYNGRSWGIATGYEQILNGAYSYNYLVSVALENSGYLSSLIEIRNVATSTFHLPYFTSMEEYLYDVQSSDVAYFGDGTNYAMYMYEYHDYGQDLQNSLFPYEAEEAAYRAFVYEHYLYVDDATRAYMEGIIAANGFSKEKANIISLVASYIQGSAAYNLEYNRDMDSEPNIVIAFLETYKEGICQHYASAATLLFRSLGIPARYTVGYVGNGVANTWADVTNMQAHAWVEIYVDGVGWFPVEVTGSDGSGAIGGGGNGSGSGGSGGAGDNAGGANDAITIRPADVYMQYDIRNTGAVLKPTGEIVGLEDLLAKGYTYEAVISGERSLPGISESRIESFILYNENHEDVTDQFNFVMKTGKVHVYMRELFVTTGSAKRTYDGTALTSQSCFITGDLLSHHTIQTFAATGSLVNVGKRVNSYTLVIVDENGRDVTEYYKINSTYGVLEVTPRVLHITANSATKPYDGNPLVDGGYTVDGTVADGQILQVTVVGYQLSVGRSENTITSVTLTDADGNDTISNYKITYENGKLYVTPPKN